jgi:hypothetical protein
MKVKEAAKRLWNFLCKIVRGIIRIGQKLADALTLGDAPRNLGLTNQTVTTVAAAVAPVIVPPGTIERLGAAAKALTLHVLAPISHLVPGLGVAALKVSLSSPAVIGCALATCAVAVILLVGLRLVERVDARVPAVARFAESCRVFIDRLKSVFSFAFC